MEEAGCPIELTELKETIRKLKDSAPGADELHNAFIRRLPEEYLHKLLHLYNRVYSLGVIPRSWKLALIIAILKGNKPPSLPGSYRQISLLSCLAKVLEKIIGDRLYWVSERLGMLSPDQSGFRSRLSTTDQVARLEDAIRSGLVGGRSVAVVFLDLAAAYDSVPHNRLLSKLAQLGLRGPLLAYIRNFLHGRKCRVTCGGATSSTYTTEVGLPQGSCLSPLLFNLYISDLPKSAETLKAEYADDIALVADGCTELQAVNRIKQHLAGLETYFSGKGLKINAAKTKAMMFSNSRETVHPPIRAAGTDIEYVQSFRYLGIVLEAPKLSWKEQITSNRIAGSKAIQVLKAISGKSWGADKRMMLRVYRALVL